MSKKFVITSSKSEIENHILKLIESNETNAKKIIIDNCNVLDKALYKFYSMNPMDLFSDSTDDDNFDLEFQKTFFMSLIKTDTSENIPEDQKESIDKIVNEIYDPYLQYLNENSLNIDFSHAPTISDLLKELKKHNFEFKNLKRFAIFGRTSPSIKDENVIFFKSNNSTEFTMNIHNAFVLAKSNYFKGMKTNLIITDYDNTKWVDYANHVCRRLPPLSCSTTIYTPTLW